ncbi:Transglutaminase-like superfamily protein [Arcanobacterium phocae]|uniref:Transglutaminase-like superfamily protein n=1 Tax=Arcanobacterium phocae TaxID=131112 RepID=A0A1H2LCB3_9ACTO|nr:transglutaminase domain-containing protein [Arcanobacterium phocae]SDU78643.1 Transglutaminase-like superfamily protein [Arcanobacterium phocae]
MQKMKSLIGATIALCVATTSAHVGLIDPFGMNSVAHASQTQSDQHPWQPSQGLKSYLSRKIDWSKPTLAPQGKIDLRAAQEYLIKGISEMQGVLVFYGDYDLSDRAITSVIYSPSYGSLVKHVAGEWKIDKEEVSFEKGLYKHTVRFAYLVNKNDAIRADQRIDEIAQFLTKKLDEQKPIPRTDGSNDFRKARLIHDYIIKNVEPEADDKTANGQYFVNSAEGDGKKYEIHSLEAGLFAKKGVCQTYAIMFDRIASRMGLETRFLRGKKTFDYYVEGDTKTKDRLDKQAEADKKIAAKGGRWSEANHAWNQVKIDGHWYHLDLTVDAVAARSLYKYTYGAFLLTDAEFDKPATWWLGIYDNKSYTGYANVTWNKNEAEPALTPMSFGSLFSPRDMYRAISPAFNGSNHLLGNFNDLTESHLPSHTKMGNAQPVSQLISPHQNDVAVEVPAGTSTADLPQALNIQGITTSTSEKPYVLGTLEDSPVFVDNAADWESVKDTIGENVTLQLLAQNGAKLTIPVSVVEPGKESHALARINTGDGIIHVEQIHPSGDSYDARADKEAFDERRTEAEKTILNSVKVSYADGTTDTSSIELSVRGLDTVKVDVPGSYPVLVVAKGKDGLRTKADYTVVVDKKLKPSSVTISTNNNADAFNIAADTKYYIAPSSFHSFLGKRESVNLIAKRTTSLGFSSQVNDVISLIDSTGKEWPYDEKEDMFIDADGNRLFDGIKMVDLVRKPGSYRIKVTARYEEEAPQVRELTVNITDDTDTASAADQHEAIMTVDRLNNLSMTSKIKYERQIRELSSTSAINGVVERAKNDHSEKTFVSYTVEHIDKETGEPLTYPVKKIDFLGATVSEKAESYLLNKGYQVDTTEQAIQLSKDGQKIVFTYSRSADQADQAD